MADLQCKVCGKNIEIPDGVMKLTHTCGAEIVVPSKLSDLRIEKFNTAYKYFRAQDFKNAEAAFNDILSSRAKNDYEANWCLALCTFKIVYFENTVAKRIDMFSYYEGNEAFTDSQYYKTAVLNAPAPIKAVYRKNGKEINEIVLNKRSANEKRRKAFNLIAQGKYDEAEKFLNEILETSSHEPMAYIGKLLCELNLKKIEELSTSEVSLTQYKNYNNAIQCADKETKVFLNKFNMEVSERLNQLNEIPEEEYIHTLDQMELTAEDTLGYTPADKALDLAFSIRDRYYRLLLFFREHARGLKIALITFCILVALGLASLILGLTVFAPPDYYIEGLELFQNGKIVEAAENLALAKNNSDSVNLLKSEEFLEEIRTLYNSGKIREAVRLSNLCGINVTGINELDMLLNETISVGPYHTIAITENKTVSAVSHLTVTDYGECNVTHWKNVISVSAGTNHSVALTADGTVLAIGDNRFGQCNVSEWEDIIAVSAGNRHTVGLKSDGTVVVTEYLGKNYNGQGDVSSWKNVIAISAGSDYTVGLLSNGKVVSTKPMTEIDSWENVIAISAGNHHVLALTKDGKVLSTDKVKGTDFGQTDVSDWKDIVKISAGNKHSLGLQADGKLLSTEYIGDDYKGQCDIDNWTKVLAFSAGLDSSVALTEKYQFVSTEKTNIANLSYN